MNMDWLIDRFRGASEKTAFVHEHRRRKDNTRLYHVDCYRLASLDDAESIGIEDILRPTRNAVLLWKGHPSPEDEATIRGCLK